jgi:hypothetical protein
VATGARFLLDYRDAAGAQVREPLARCWGERFEGVEPVRGFGYFPGQRHFPGLWWFATTGNHVGYESWLERDHVMRLDFDPEVLGLASQPFRLVWDGASHVPDYFARRADGSAEVIDVRPDHRIKSRDVLKFTATAEACETVGWSYARVGDLDEMVKANLSWLAGYRHRRFGDPVLVQRLRGVLGTPISVVDAVAAVGDWMRVAPTLFHLMWSGAVEVDLEAGLLGQSSRVIWRNADVGLAAG